MKSKMNLNEILFVLPLGIIINIVLIKFLKTNNLIIQGLMIAVIFTILSIVYRESTKSKK